MNSLYHTDCESLWSDMKRQEKQLKRKRRWLMGLPSSAAEQKQLREPELLESRSLPETFLRKDDVFYETIKTSVDAAFGAYSVAREQDFASQDSMQVLDMLNITRLLISHLDDFTNKGLYLLAKIFTGGSAKFEKTRKKMKKVVRESLPRIPKNKNHNHYQIEFLTKLSQVLNNPHNFRENCVTSLAPADVVKVLNKLQDFKFQTLVAMDRKLQGGLAGILQLLRKRSDRNCKRMIKKVSKSCQKMLSELGNRDQLQEPLVKAMEVAGLSLNLPTGFQNQDVTELQYEIAKAIWLTREKAKIHELRNLQHLLDPKADISNNGLRPAIERMLFEFLFECSDMDTIPKSLRDAVETINKDSQSIPHECFPKEKIEEEVECILTVSAQTKQLVFDLIPDYDFEQDFTDAYMEDLAESDDDELCQLELNNSQGSSLHSSDLDDLVEGFGESKPIDSLSPTSTTKGNDSSPILTPNKGQEFEYDTGADSSDLTDIFSSVFSCKQGTSRNQYLAIQEVCDETSMVAYNLIGHIMEGFSQREGLGLDHELYLRGGKSIPEDSQGLKEKQTSLEAEVDEDGLIIIRAVEELVPSFSKSGIERVKKLLSLM